MPLLPPTLPSLLPCSHASRLPRLVVGVASCPPLPWLLASHCLPSSGASTHPPLVAPPPLVMPLFFSAGGLPLAPLVRLVVALLLFTPLRPSVHLCLRLSLPRRLSLCPLFCLLSSWLLRCLSLHCRLPSTGASHCANASSQRHLQLLSTGSHTADRRIITSLSLCLSSPKNIVHFEDLTLAGGGTLRTGGSNSVVSHTASLNVDAIQHRI